MSIERILQEREKYLLQIEERKKTHRFTKRGRERERENGTVSNVNNTKKRNKMIQIYPDIERHMYVTTSISDLVHLG